MNQVRQARYLILKINEIFFYSARAQDGHRKWKETKQAQLIQATCLAVA